LNTSKMFNMRIKCAGKLLRYFDDHEYVCSITATLLRKHLFNNRKVREILALNRMHYGKPRIHKT